jgi:hypothetical protein
MPHSLPDEFNPFRWPPLDRAMWALWEDKKRGKKTSPSLFSQACGEILSFYRTEKEHGKRGLYAETLVALSQKQALFAETAKTSRDKLNALEKAEAIAFEVTLRESHKDAIHAAGGEQWRFLVDRLAAIDPAKAETLLFGRIKKTPPETALEKLATDLWEGAFLEAFDAKKAADERRAIEEVGFALEAALNEATKAKRLILGTVALAFRDRFLDDADLAPANKLYLASYLLTACPDQYARQTLVRAIAEQAKDSFAAAPKEAMNAIKEAARATEEKGGREDRRLAKLWSLLASQGDKIEMLEKAIDLALSEKGTKSEVKKAARCFRKEHFRPLLRANPTALLAASKDPLSPLRPLIARNRRRVLASLMQPPLEDSVRLAALRALRNCVDDTRFINKIQGLMKRYGAETPTPPTGKDLKCLLAQLRATPKATTPHP